MRGAYPLEGGAKIQFFPIFQFLELRKFGTVWGGGGGGGIHTVYMTHVHAGSLR